MEGKPNCNKCRCSGEVNTSFDSSQLQWKYVCGVGTDEAPAMMGSR